MLRCYLHPVGDDKALVVALTALVLLGLLAWVRVPAKASRGKRRVLVGLRLASLAMLVLAMLRPTFVLTETRKQSATVVLLIDRSRSMQVHDEVNGRSRWEALKKALADARAALRSLGGDFDVRVYTFAAEARPAAVDGGAIDLPDAPDGNQTALGAVLEDVLVLPEVAGKRLLGVVLLSDGSQRAYPPRDTLPQTAANRLKHLGCPLFPVRFGQSRGLGQATDVAVTEMLADQRVFVKNELSVTGQVRIDGCANRPIPVKLLVESADGKMEIVDQQTVKATADGQRIPFQFTYVPQSPGEFKISVEAEPQPGELVAANNRLSSFVQVLKGGIQVLYLEGFPARPEMPALRRSLGASPDIHLRDVVINFSGRKADEVGAPDTRPAGMSEWFKPGKFDVYILGDLNSNAFRREELTELADAVFKGAGLIMLGGIHTFGPGGYAETDLAKVLPVTMDRFERQNPGDAPSADLHLPGPVRIHPTQKGLLRSSLMLAASPQESAAVWARLPPLKGGANRFLGLKPLADVLANSDNDEPLLVSHQYGDGRVMAFAADSTWLWWTHGFEAAHKRFWRQIVLWLAKKEESSEGNVWVRLSQRRFDPGHRVEFTVGAQGPSGDPVPGATYQAEVVLPDGTKQPVPLVRSDPGASGSYRDTIRAGDYTILVTARAQGQQLGTGRARFLVSERDLELDNPVADPTLLDNLAAMTGGEAVVSEELPALLDRLNRRTETLVVQSEVKRTFWDTWPFFVAFVALLGSEWYLRKRWGLV
jgi:hypothetical protein